MQVFLKQNISFFSVLGFLLITYLTMFIYSCGLEKKVGVATKKVASSRNVLQDILSEQAGFNDVAENLLIAREDREALAKSRKEGLSKLNLILEGDSLLEGANRKSSQDVNGDLQGFIQRYREHLPAKNIIIKGGDVASGVSVEGKERESFGFSKYDGFWPSFEDEEAREIFKQKQIIKRLLDMLVIAREKNPTLPLELRNVKRELVGEEDAKKADARETLIVAPLSHALVKRPGKIETYAFRLDLLGRTGVLRDFVAQLDTPFTVSDLEVHRAEGSIEDSLPFDNRLPFDLESAPPPSAPSPIIENVNSRFVVTVEYLTAIHAEPEQFLKTYYDKKDEQGRLQPLPGSVATFLSEQVFELKRESFDALFDALSDADSD